MVAAGKEVEESRQTEPTRVKLSAENDDILVSSLLRFTLGSYLVLVCEEYFGLLIEQPCQRALEELSPLCRVYFQPVWPEWPSCVAASRFNPQTQKRKPQHSSPWEEERKQNKQISKHFCIETSNAPCDENNTPQLLFNWHIDNLKLLMEKSKGGAEWKRDQPKLTTIREW